MKEEIELIDLIKLADNPEYFHATILLVEERQPNKSYALLDMIEKLMGKSAAILIAGAHSKTRTKKAIADWCLDRAKWIIDANHIDVIVVATETFTPKELIVYKKLAESGNRRVLKY